jgi:Zn-dependent M32 family carboxypeptidase
MLQIFIKNPDRILKIINEIKTFNTYSECIDNIKKIYYNKMKDLYDVYMALLDNYDFGLSKESTIELESELEIEITKAIEMEIKQQSQPTTTK